MSSWVKQTQRDYTLAFKLPVVDQVEKGEMSNKEAQDRHGIPCRPGYSELCADPRPLTFGHSHLSTLGISPFCKLPMKSVNGNLFVLKGKYRATLIKRPSPESWILFRSTRTIKQSV